MKHKTIKSLFIYFLIVTLICAAPVSALAEEISEGEHSALPTESQEHVPPETASVPPETGSSAPIQSEGNEQPTAQPTTQPTTEAVEKPKTESPAVETQEQTVDLVPAEEKTPVEDEKAGVIYEPGEVLVEFKEDAAPMQAMSVLNENEAEPQEQVTDAIIREGEPVVVDIDDTITVEQAVEILKNDPLIENAQPNYLYYELEAQDYEGYTTVINDPLASQQWHLKNINIYDAWDYQKTNQAVKVAVIDSGIGLNHPDLKNNIDFANAYDEYLDQPLAGDISGHGTHVSGIVAAETNNAVGMAGVSYNASIVPINVFRIDSGTNKAMAATSDIVDAYNRIMNIRGLRVINMSLGQYNAYDRALEQKVNEAEAKGIMTVCAGGNGDQYGIGRNYPVYPSDFEACVSVVPTNENNLRPNWADYNAQKDIAAPGINIWSTSSVGEGAWYETKQGSSMAAPVVSGVAAMIFAADPSLSVQKVKDILYSTATDLGTPGKDIYYGWGKVDAGAALKKTTQKPEPNLPVIGSFEIGIKSPTTQHGFALAATGVRAPSGVREVQFWVVDNTGNWQMIPGTNRGNGTWDAAFSTSLFGGRLGWYTFNACAIDNLGNRVDTIQQSIAITADGSGPSVGSFEIGTESPTTRQGFALATANVSDPSGVREVQFWVVDNAGNWRMIPGTNHGNGTWDAAFSTSLFGGRQGWYTFNACAIDNLENRTDTVQKSVAIVGDTSGPSVGSFEIGTESPTTRQGFALATANVSDPSGVREVQFWVVDNAGNWRMILGTNHGNGTWDAAFNTSMFGGGLGWYTFNACVIDNLGNRTDTVQKSVAIIGDTSGPSVGSFEIGTESPTKRHGFALAATGVSDPSGVSEVQFWVVDEAGNWRMIQGTDHGNGTWDMFFDTSLFGGRAGTYTFNACAVDGVGNKTNTSYLSVQIF